MQKSYESTMIPDVLSVEIPVLLLVDNHWLKAALTSLQLRKLDVSAVAISQGDFRACVDELTTQLLVKVTEILVDVKLLHLFGMESSALRGSAHRIRAQGSGCSVGCLAAICLF